jgi:hypothetical protein
LYKNYSISGYICITEEFSEWQSDNKRLSVVVHTDDFVTVKPDDEGNQGYDETILVRHVYLDDFTILEAMIRDALVESRIEITHHQLERVLTPVMSDNNNNVIHHLSFNNLEKIESILEMPGVDHYYGRNNDQYPIYFNFLGLSQINLSLKARDFKTFYLLLDILMDYQDNI